MSDLIRGRYPATHPLSKLLGAYNATQGNIAIRSNIEWLGIGNLTDGALAATGVATAVPIPVEVGDQFTKITILVGGTAASTPTHSAAALYSGIATPALVGSQSVDTTTTAIAASAAFVYTLPSPVTVTATNAPYGFIYASLTGTATAVQTAASIGTPTAVGYQWLTNAPLFLAATHGSSLNGTMPATIASPAAKAVAPIVFLS